MSGIVRRLEWDRQASLGIGLARGGDLARGLVLAINGNNPDRNLANDVAVIARNGMGTAAAGTAIGLSQPSAAAKGVQVDSGRLLSGSGGNFTGMTVVIVANPPNAGGWLMGLCLSAQTGNEWYVGWGTQLSGSSSAGTFNINTWSGTGVDVFGVCDGKDHVFAATFPEGAGTTASAYVDGVKTTGTVANSLPNTNSAAYVGGYWANGYAVNGFRQALTLGWNRELSEKEIAEVTRNPWQIFGPEQIYVPFTSSGATDYPVTATDALTLADSASQSFAATGVAADAMTLADSASNVASLGASGTAALTLADSASNVAALSATATDALTLADTLNATASGDYTAIGSDALTLADSASNVAVLGATASDALTLADAASNVAAFIATITEAMTLADTSNGSTTGMFTATITESMFLADTLLAAGGSPASFWTQISTTQVAGWGQTDNTQSSGWTIIPTT